MYRMLSTYPKSDDEALVDEIVQRSSAVFRQSSGFRSCATSVEHSWDRDQERRGGSVGLRRFRHARGCVGRSAVRGLEGRQDGQRAAKSHPFPVRVPRLLNASSLLVVEADAAGASLRRESGVRLGIAAQDGVRPTRAVSSFRQVQQCSVVHGCRVAAIGGVHLAVLVLGTYLAPRDRSVRSVAGAQSGLGPSAPIVVVGRNGWPSAQRRMFCTVVSAMAASASRVR